jgi:hypothetical protein
MQSNLPPQRDLNQNQVEKFNEVAQRDRGEMELVLKEYLQGAVLSEKQPEDPIFIKLENGANYTFNVFFCDVEGRKNSFAIGYLKTHAAPDGRVPKSSGFTGNMADVMKEVMQKYPKSYFYFTSELNEASYNNIGGAHKKVAEMKAQPNHLGSNNTRPKLNIVSGIVTLLISQFAVVFVDDMPDAVERISKDVLPKFKKGQLQQLQDNKPADLTDIEEKINQSEL